MNAEYSAVVMLGLGYALQWAKAPRGIPTWLAYAACGGLAIAAFMYLTPEVDKVSSWREAVTLFLKWGQWAFGIEGVARVSTKVNAAPATNSK